MEVTTDLDANKIVHREIPTNMSTLEENEEISFSQKELLTSHQLECGEKEPLEKECEAKQLNESFSEKENEAMFCEKLEDERAVIIVNENGILMARENECDKPDESAVSDVKQPDNARDSCVISTDVPNIQATSKENDETAACKYTATGENESDIIQESLKESPKVVECSTSNDTNTVQCECSNDEVINEVAEVNICDNEMQMNNPSLQKQDCDKVSSLGIIATEYGDTDSEVEEMKTAITIENQCTVPQIQTQNLQQYRTVEENLYEEIDCEDSDSVDTSSSSSSSSTSSSSSSSDSSSDSDSDDIEVININKKKETSINTAKKGKRTQNELDDLPPIEDLQISVPEVLCNPLGKIENIVEQLVIVKPMPGEPTLNLDTVLFVKKGTKALGKIFDVFGPVNEPYYCVRFNDAKHIEDNDIKVGMQVYYCPSNKSYTSVVFLSDLTKIKACDTVGDDEPPEFSDDEEEQAYYETLKKKNNKDCFDPKKKRRQTEPYYAAMGWQSNHPWSTNRNVRFQRYNRRRQQNWSGGNYFDSAQDGPYPYSESWQQFPYQDNTCWQPIPQNMHSMSNRSYVNATGYNVSYNEPHLSQYGNSSNSNGANQYYQGANLSFQSNNKQNPYPKDPFSNPSRFNSASLSTGVNYQFSNTPYPYLNTPSYPAYPQPALPMIDPNAYWPPSVPSSSDTVNESSADPNSPK